jgi:hypothetical protein
MGLHLLSTSTAKLDKSQNSEWLNAILFLEPAMNYVGICPHSSKGCRQSCLTNSGMMRYPNAVKARHRRTSLWLESPEDFITLLNADILALKLQAKKVDKRLAIRLNGTSDIDWSEVYKRHPDVQFYEYTKRHKLAQKLYSFDNVHITLSAHERTTDNQINTALLSGINVAVVFRDVLPDTYQGHTVINGDDHDRRYEDTRGVIIGLKLKGTNKAKQAAIDSGFAREGV